MPFSRGNTPERMEGAAPRTPGAPQPEPPAAAAEESAKGVTLPDSPNAAQAQASDTPQQTQRGPSAGVIADAIRNVQKYASRRTRSANLQGGESMDFEKSIQFDSKGVEFGPWLRRFIAQIRRNWIIPMAAMSMHGHVVVTFYVGKDGRITELRVLRPSNIDGFNNSSLQRAGGVQSDTAASARVSGRPGVLHHHVLLQRKPRLMIQPTRAQQIGLLLMLAALAALALVRALADR